MSPRPSHDLDPAQLAILFDLAVELDGALEAGAVARAAARAASELCGGRGVLVQLLDEDAPGGAVAAASGPEMSARMHVEAVPGRAGSSGELVVDVARALEPGERTALGALLERAASAAARVRRERRQEREWERLLAALDALAERRAGRRPSGRARRLAAAVRALLERARAADLLPDDLHPRAARDLVLCAPLVHLSELGVPEGLLLRAPSDAEAAGLRRASEELAARALLGELGGTGDGGGRLEQARQIAAACADDPSASFGARLVRLVADWLERAERADGRATREELEAGGRHDFPSALFELLGALEGAGEGLLAPSGARRDAA